ncbi:hypothetical protein [Glycomyces terrestris]|uniref:Secreted protein n=1 Tax=Glycomyces terrestris TaxID=2493553 RepID=A0A426UTY1_9ACTN|nr:hypothetical protein [Glycomyces terrestris]RRR97371.1 hypothetical protein EIW28_18355 [Glycomyces terrestris]
MAESMFNEARVQTPKKTWRAAVVGLAVPALMLVGAPAVSAAGTTAEPVQAVAGEQLPGVPLPGGLPDPAALADLPALLTCVTDLLDKLGGAAPPLPAPAGEQLPGLPLPAPPAPGGDAPLPDITALNDKCQAALANLPEVPVDPPADLPVPAN